MTENTTTTTKTRDELRDALHLAMSKLDAIKNHPCDFTMQESASIMDELNKAKSAYSIRCLTDMYDCIASAENPVMELCNRRSWDMPVVKSHTEKTTGMICSTLEARKTRLSILSFIEYTKTGEDNKAIIEAIKAFSADLKHLVLANITNEQGGSVAKCKESLDVALKLMGQKACKKSDIRFMEYACTRAAGLGELSDFNETTVAPFIMDVVHTHAENIGYKFEMREKEGKKKA